MHPCCRPSFLSVQQGGFPALLVGQRYGSGSSKSPCFESAQRKVRCCWGRWQTQERWARLAHFLISPTFLTPPLISSSAVSLSLSWRTRWLPSAAASLSVGKNHKTIQCIDFGAKPERETLRKFYFSAVYRSGLTRLLALIFLVSTLLSAVIFLMFSWASFNLWKKKEKRYLQIL